MSVAPDPGLAPNVFRRAASVGDGCVERTVTTTDGVRRRCRTTAPSGSMPRQWF